MTRTHGRPGTYTAGCRCKKCTEAWRDYRADRPRPVPIPDREATRAESDEPVSRGNDLPFIRPGRSVFFIGGWTAEEILDSLRTSHSGVTRGTP